MARIRPLPIWRHRLLLALICVIGLSGRVAAPVVTMPMLASALLGDGICHADPDAASGKQPTHDLDCEYCLDCHAVAHPALLPDSPVGPVARIAWSVSTATLLPEATGPPGVAASPFRSRGPPAHSV